MVKFVDLETGINELERVHNLVDPSDSFEKDLFESTVDALKTLYAANHHKMISDSDLRKEGLNFVNLYFEAYSKQGFIYKMD